MTRRLGNADDVAAAILDAVGPRIVLALPVGIGKAVHVANALFDRAAEDPSIRLTIFTALTLETPRAGSDLERRLLEPLTDRLFEGWPALRYARALRDGSMPPNVEVREFYFRPAAYLGVDRAQQRYTSLNYTQVSGALEELGVNVIGQLVSTRPESPGRVSLSSNPEVTLDMLESFFDARRGAGDALLVGQVNPELPYMLGEAELDEERFDLLLDAPECRFPLFGIPNRSVSAADFATGMHVASLVPDGGTIQLGIGSLSDAVAHALLLRHEKPAVFRSVLERLPGGPGSGRPAHLPVEGDPFEQGLFASTELLSDAVFALFERGVVDRGFEPDEDPEGEALIHAGFFVGSPALYEGLRELPEERRRLVQMRRISWVNSLHGDEAVKRHQRREGRFVNEAMMVTLLGAAVSDGLEDGRVVSGVGGQFDFVRMAHELEDGRSILMVASHRVDDGRPRSNIRFRYGHVTVPRHYRDIFVTEYGIADTRGRPDEEVIAALLEIADARFQEELRKQAVDAGKLPPSHRLSPSARANRPSTIDEVFEDPAVAPHFPPYPMGSTLTPVERRLAAALRWLKERTATRRGTASTVVSALLRRIDPGHGEALRRMRLARPASLGERVKRRLVALALDRTASRRG